MNHSKRRNTIDILTFSMTIYEHVCMILIIYCDFWEISFEVKGSSEENLKMFLCITLFNRNTGQIWLNMFCITIEHTCPLKHRNLN